LTIFSVKTLLYKSAEKRDPSLLAQYALTLAKKFNSLYNNLHIINEKNNDTKIMRLIIAKTVSDVLENILGLFGIKIVKKM
jgi:arginyl-tRNA synthetase